jgi:hypothetical protein
LVRQLRLGVGASGRCAAAGRLIVISFLSL